ncbi:MAG TPA: TniQ family protein, partial [Methylotenera sp.]|nr:TniQ family protein [Methylotenera sp.]
MSNLILPPMYKDMTFYSWMATTHMINGYPSAYQLSEKLLGNGSAGTRLDFPSHLAKFCSNTSNAFGDVYSLSKNSTVLPYYLTFRPINLIDNCVRLMASNSVEHLKFILGLPPTHAHQFSNLKFCPECFELDVQVHGYGYWHRSHQLSSTHVCTTHGEQLRVCRLREDGRGKTELALPSLHSSYGIQVSTNSHPLLESLSELSVRALMSLLPSEFNPKQLQFTYQHGLKQHGLITPGGLIRVNEFLYRLHKYFGPILSISPYD